MYTEYSRFRPLEDDTSCCQEAFWGVTVNLIESFGCLWHFYLMDLFVVAGGEAVWASSFRSCQVESPVPGCRQGVP